MSANSILPSNHSLNSAVSQGLLLSQLMFEGRQHEVALLSRVNLPGVELDSYSGYITVDDKFNSNLFFWLFPATKVQPEQAPLIVYLNGGPGNSSLIGLFEEIGPIKVDQMGRVSKREVTWTDLFNVVFIDNPVNVGFSYCDQGGKADTTDKAADQLHCFLCQFLKMYTQFKQCEMYIGGLMLPLFPDFLVSLGILSAHEGSEVRLAIEEAIHTHKTLGQHEEAIRNVIGIIFNNMQDHTGYRELDNLLKTEEYKWHFESYLNQPEVQKALHVKNKQYKFFNEQTILDMAEDFFGSVSKELAEVMDTVKVLIFSGQIDLVVNIPMTEAFLKDLPWSGQIEYQNGTKKQWISTDGNVAGYVTKVKNLTRVVLRSAGHRCAIDQPVWVFDMINRFISEQSFNS